MLRKGIMFRNNIGLLLEAYTDAVYVGSVLGRRSTTVYCTFSGGIWFMEKEQNVVATSSATLEFKQWHKESVCYYG